MRLSTDVFNAMDTATHAGLRMAALLASAGRFGLFTAPKPFELSVNISGNALEVSSLCCHGITKSGCIIDIDYDSNFNNTFDTRVSIPSASEGEAFYLVVKINEGEWREINETFSELSYSFDLVSENSAIAKNCLPVGMLVNQYGWRLNETDFVPPCLYASAHPKFQSQLEMTKDYAKEIINKCLSSQNCIAKTLLSQVWATASGAYFRLDKERDTLTPAQLLAIVQQLINSFVVGCFADEYVSLENQDPFVMYTLKPYDIRNIYRDIEAGLALCAEISTKIGAVCAMVDVKPKAEEPAPAPAPAPKPKPAPAPEPRPIKRGWEGIEI